jgi:hypothetical protein
MSLANVSSELARLDADGMDPPSPPAGLKGWRDGAENNRVGGETKARR